MDDAFIPRDDPVDASDEEMDEFDRELDDFKRFSVLHGQAAIGIRPRMQGCREGLTLNTS